MDSDLRQLQRRMASMLFRPLDSAWRMQRTTADGRRTRDAAAEFIKPNDRLTAFERLEIYNRQYWFRVLDCLYDDYPGLRAILGERRFLKLCRAYLAKYPSESFTLRDLGSRLVQFLVEEPEWAGARGRMAVDMARFEWAQIVAFDGPARPVVAIDELLDTPPGDLRLGLQPYLSLLDLDHAVDRFLTAIRKRESDTLRGEASNAVAAAPARAESKRRPRPPRAEKVFVAVHRYDTDLFYKRLEPAAWRLLAGLRDGRTLEDACLRAAHDDAEVAEKFQPWFAEWAELGWFCSFKNSTP